MNDALLNRLDRLIGAMEAHTAVAAGLATLIAQHTAAMNAVADSHAQLLAALLMPDEETGADAPVQVDGHGFEHGDVLDARGNSLRGDPNA